ncbi:UPF0721 transmembrane protein [Allostella vacuolata]|nr:UPF0721 transmembrane protein [Stella vacuolata]
MADGSLVLALLIFLTAIVYSIVGQAGATGYLAVMGAFGFEPAVMKPTALALNLTVAAIGAVRFARAGHLDGRAFWPLALLGVPAAGLGGAISLPAAIYHPLVGTVLLLAAIQLARSTRARPAAATQRPPIGWSILAGGGVGLLSGLTGTGGGVFLAPLLLLAGWAGARQAAALSAACNLVASAAGLAGAWATAPALPGALPLWIPLVAAGALIGSGIGSYGLPDRPMRLVLAAILAAAGAKLVLS